MPTSKAPRPDPNILDLRQMVADRRRQAEERKSSWPARMRRPRQSALVSPRPRLAMRDWMTFRREMLKFGLVLLLVGLISATAIVATKVVAAKSSVERQANTGVTELRAGLAAIGQADPQSAAAHFSAAEDSFTSAQATLSKAVPPLVDRTPWLGGRAGTARVLIDQAQQMAAIGRRLSAIVPKNAASQPAVSIQSNGIIQGSIGVVTPLLEQRTEFVGIVEDAVRVIDTIEQLDVHDVPGSIRDSFMTWRRLFNGLVGSGETLENLTTVLINLLAPEQPREYLVIFQNNDELRPTGGFPGTFLLIKFEQGTFKILDAPGNGPYALSDDVAKKNLPPQPVLSIVPFWTFHDANWYLDVPTSARTMLDFYAQDRGFTPDGMIFLTPGLMEDMLRITGPIRPKKYAVDITADNFVAATEQQVQFGYDKALNNPKQFLIDLVPEMLTKLSQVSGPDALRAIALTLKRANQGDILLYSGQDSMQATIAKLGWDGSLLPVDGDYLAVVDTNLGGGKTDRQLEEKVRTEVTLDNGLLRHRVTVTRTNNNPTDSAVSGFANQSFVRVYAPPDAQFVSVTGATVPDEKFFVTPATTAKASTELLKNEGQTLYDQVNGIRITNESGRKVFGAWSVVALGQSQTLEFMYTTPAPTNGVWHLDWQHQPGATVRTWIVTFAVPQGKRITDVDPSGTMQSGNRSVTFSSDSTINRSFNAVVK